MYLIGLHPSFFNICPWDLANIKLMHEKSCLIPVFMGDDSSRIRESGYSCMQHTVFTQYSILPLSKINISLLEGDKKLSQHDWIILIGTQGINNKHAERYIFIWNDHIMIKIWCILNPFKNKALIVYKKSFKIIILNDLFACWVICMHFLSFLINGSKPFECQTVWTQIRTDGLNCLQILSADYFLLLSLAGEKF